MSTEATRAEFKIVAHQISEGAEGVTARLVLEDEEGFSRAVLAIGEPAATFWGAAEDAVRVYESKLRAVEVPTRPTTPEPGAVYSEPCRIEQSYRGV